MKKHRLLSIVLSVTLISFMVSCTKPDDGGSGNSDNPGNPITPIDPINPINPNTPEDIWGVYNPGKKIRRVYHKSVYSETKYLDQFWQWEGDFLESIKYYRENGTINYVEQFVYDGQHLSRIEYSEGDYRGYVVFNYENNELKSAECYGPYDYSALRCKWRYVNQDGKLSKIIYQTEYYDISIQFTWHQDNISMISITGKDEYNNTVELYYDQNSNPYKGFISYWDICLDTWDFIKNRSSFSLNNVTKAVFSNPIRNHVYNFVYQYDEDGFPTEQQYYNSYSEYEGTYYYTYE